jgi:hypothetical protein
MNSPWTISLNTDCTEVTREIVSEHSEQHRMAIQTARLLWLRHCLTQFKFKNYIIFNTLVSKASDKLSEEPVHISETC